MITQSKLNELFPAKTNEEIHNSLNSKINGYLNINSLFVTYDIKYNEKNLSYFQYLCDRIKCKPNEIMFFDEYHPFYNSFVTLLGYNYLINNFVRTTVYNNRMDVFSLATVYSKFFVLFRSEQESGVSNPHALMIKKDYKLLEKIMLNKLLLL